MVSGAIGQSLPPGENAGPSIPMSAAVPHLRGWRRNWLTVVHAGRAGTFRGLKSELIAGGLAPQFWTPASHHVGVETACVTA